MITVIKNERKVFNFYLLLIDWNLAANGTNFDQQKLLERKDSLQDQEPYSNIIKIYKRIYN